MASGSITCGVLEKIISDTALTNNTAKTFTPGKAFSNFKNIIFTLNINGVNAPIEVNTAIMLLKGGSRCSLYVNANLLGYFNITNFTSNSVTVAASLSGAQTLSNLNIEVYGVS